MKKYKFKKRKKVSFFKKYYKEIIFGLVIGIFVSFVIIKLVQNKDNISTNTAQSSSSNIPGLPTLIDLGTTTCTPCQMMIPVLEELRTNYKGKLNVEFINTADNQAKAQQYGITVIPTQIFFDNKNKEIFRHTGYFSTQEILDTFKDKGIDIH